MSPDDPAVRADDELVEDLRCGARPPRDDQIAALLAQWRDDTRSGTTGG